MNIENIENIGHSEHPKHSEQSTLTEQSKVGEHWKCTRKLRTLGSWVLSRFTEVIKAVHIENIDYYKYYQQCTCLEH